MEELIGSLCSQHGKLKDSQLRSLLETHGKFTPGEEVEAINKLLAKGKITICEEDGEVVYQGVSETHAGALRSLEASSAMILQLIRESGEKGSWNGDIKKMTGIPITQINKILNTMQKQGLVFSHKSVSSNKNTWFIQGTKPNSDATGGFLFAEEGFDSSLMNEICCNIKLLLSDKSCSAREILDYVRLQVNKNISEENISEVIRSMQALNEIAEVNSKFRIVKEFSLNPLVVPCFACSLRHECREDGVINPSDCEYLNAWLDY